ncbi:hypothetical protein [Sorangium sp. So ce1024]|uniref:hypothetical protein n=1 Tax=Sorangium sp. So ce1024 TaxID=3133327 RepID=UPI003F0BE673
MTFLDRLGELLFWPLVLAERREERRQAEQRARLDRDLGYVRAGSAYKAAMSQASQAHGEQRDRMAALARRSLTKGDVFMGRAGMRPDDHPWRAGAVRRMAECGIAANENQETP